MVEWKKLGEICTNLDYRRKPITGSKRIFGIYPYYGASGIVDYIDNYIFDGDFLLVSEDGANLLARTTPIAFSIKGKNWVNNHAHVLEFTNKVTQKYVETYLNMIDLSSWISGGAQPKLNQANLNVIPVPIPSLSEQSRIVSILDTFTASIENLKEQIAERRKQYEYQRDQLLDLEGKEGVEMKKLGEIIQVKKGEYITKKEAKEGIYPVILGGKEPAYYIDKYNHTGKAMVMSRSGASAGYVSLWNEPIFVTDGFLIEPRGDVVFEYLYYTLKSKQGELHGSQKGGAIPHVTPASIGVIQVRLPNISVQSRIVSILDTFEASIANLEAQLELRQKQYEYYRNKLLTFE